MASLVRIGNTLSVVGGQLVTDAGGAPCCCGPGSAVKFAECCDGDPSIWVDAALVEGCQTIHVGELCYSRTGETAQIVDLERAGVAVMRRFGPETDGCVSGCYDSRCRPCPTECCIRALLPACRTDEARRCCILGSAYALRLTKTVEYRVWGAACLNEYNPGPNSCFTQFPSGACVGFVTDPLIESTETLRATMFHSGNDLFGYPCSGITPSANRFYRRTGRGWFVDGYTVDAQPINGRYEPIDESWQDQQFMLARGEMPQVAYIDVGDHGEACNASRTFTACERQETDLDPCPSPTNPIVRRDDIAVAGAWDCNGGRQVLTESGYRVSCASGNNPLTTYYTRTTTLEWTVEILSRVGCEQLNCSDGQPDPNGGGSGFIARPAGGCAGCRQESGL